MILEEIERYFPFLDMPKATEVTVHNENCRECDEVRSDFESCRDKEVTGQIIRIFQRKLMTLTAKTTQWLFPHYLRYCLTEEADRNRMEVGFFIDNLIPNFENHERVIERLNLMSGEQVRCLIHFLEWLLDDEYWGVIDPENINKAIEFLRNDLLKQWES